MRWFNEESTFRELLAHGQEIVLVDHARKETTLCRLVFDDAELCTPEFARMLRSLMLPSGDSQAFYIVLDPDPVKYFYRHFNRYLCLEIAYGDSIDSYLAALNEDPGGSPADAIGINWSISVILPQSKRWFCHLLRSRTDDGGHLWIPAEWKEKLIADYLYLRSEPQ